MLKNWQSVKNEAWCLIQMSLELARSSPERRRMRHLQAGAQPSMRSSNVRKWASRPCATDFNVIREKVDCPGSPSG